MQLYIRFTTVQGRSLNTFTGVCISIGLPHMRPIPANVLSCTNSKPSRTFPSSEIADIHDYKMTLDSLVKSGTGVVQDRGLFVLGMVVANFTMAVAAQVISSHVGLSLQSAVKYHLFDLAHQECS
jgi:hypothetical protein